MRLALAISLLVAALPAVAQVPEGDIPDGQPVADQAPTARQPLRSTTPGRQTARTAYGYRLTAPEEDEDPSDRRVLRRLNTRLNNRLETRIERYKSIDTRSERTGVTAQNPSAPAQAAESETEPVLRSRRPEDPR